MSGPKLKASGSASERPTWFQDVKSGCEKQTDYFVRIRKLQKELINREQHNLVNAMERLKQLQYPRRKPFVRNFDVLPANTKSFPTRPLNTKKQPKHRQKTEIEEIKPLKGKLLLPSKTRDDDEENVESFTLEEIKRIYSMLPIMNDKQIAKIVHDVRKAFPNEPSTYLLQPHLPSIPNVPRKANKRLDNRLRLLTLTENSCCIGALSRVPQIQQSPSPSQRQRRTDAANKDSVDKQKQKRNERRRGTKNMIAFDVDPNDSSVFSNCLSATDLEKENVDDEDSSPIPPPNSRPSSCLKNVINASDVEQCENAKDEVKDSIETQNDTNVTELSESEKSVVKQDEAPTSAVDLSGSEKSDVEKDETQKVSETKLDENHDSCEKRDDKDEKDEQLEQLESQTIESHESIDENASVVCTQPVVKITKKGSDASEN